MSYSPVAHPAKPTPSLFFLPAPDEEATFGAVVATVLAGIPCSVTSAR
ncbi:hypothetical protein [Streptomyces uncialis]